ncbi:hypothetical protein [Candidatus Uabimicrobium sp. HlEnr_7]|uniref:hypothetical protein n=1 Tax=Candidatus Uabimicrobium helgolandensis TaxID=3095367 RepID=UPI003558DFD9
MTATHNKSLTLGPIATRFLLIISIPLICISVIYIFIDIAYQKQQVKCSELYPENATTYKYRITDCYIDYRLAVLVGGDYYVPILSSSTDQIVNKVMHITNRKQQQFITDLLRKSNLKNENFIQKNRHKILHNSIAGTISSTITNTKKADICRALLYHQKQATSLLVFEEERDLAIMIAVFFIFLIPLLIGLYNRTLHKQGIFYPKRSTILIDTFIGILFLFIAILPTAIGVIDLYNYLTGLRKTSVKYSDVKKGNIPAFIKITNAQLEYKNSVWYKTDIYVPLVDPNNKQSKIYVVLKLEDRKKIFRAIEIKKNDSIKKTTYQGDLHGLIRNVETNKIKEAFSNANKKTAKNLVILHENRKPQRENFFLLLLFITFCLLISITMLYLLHLDIKKYKQPKKEKLVADILE